MKLEPVTLTLGVRPSDLDSLGHVNNAVALEYLEAGRWAWLAHHGVKRSQRVVSVVTRIEIDYRREIPFQQILIETTPLDLPPDFEDQVTYRVVFEQRVLLEPGGKPAVEARVQVAFIDAEDRSLTTLQEFLSAPAAAL